MVVGTSVMSSPRLMAARTPPRRGFIPPDPGGGGGVGEETGTAPAEEMGESGGAATEVEGGLPLGLPPGLARLVAVARHGNLGTLPPSQRHLVARVLLRYGGPGSRQQPENILLQQRQALLRRQQRCILLAQRLQQQNAEARKGEEKPVFKEPRAPLPPRLRSRVPKENAASTLLEGKRKRPEAADQWIPVAPHRCEGKLEECGGLSREDDQWRPVKVGRLCLASPSPSSLDVESTRTASPSALDPPQDMVVASPPCPLSPTSVPSATPALSPPATREAPSAADISDKTQLSCASGDAQACANKHAPDTTCMMCGATPRSTRSEARSLCPHHFQLRVKEVARRARRRRRVQCGSASHPGPAISTPVTTCSHANLGSAASCCLAEHKFSWLNQLTRIFLQESPEDAQSKEAEAAEGEAAAAARPSAPHGDGNSACSSSSNIDNSSSSNNSNNSKVAALSTPQSSSVVTTLAGSGMGNPFARAASQTTWGSESSDQKPILAPPRLAPPSESGTTKVSSSGLSVIRPSTLGSGRPGGTSRSGASLFTPPTLTVTSSSPPQAAKSAFKLKPSVLSGSANPFAKGGADPDDKADSASGLEEGPSEEPTPSLSSSQDVSSSTSGASRSPQVKQLVERETPMEEKPSPAASSLSHTCTNNSDGSSGTSNTNSSSNTSNSRSLFVPLARNGEGSDSSLSPSISRNSFIFGQNLQSKVVAGDSSVTSSSDSAATTNGENQTGNLFSDAASEMSRVPESAATNGRMTTGNLFSDAASEISLPREDGLWNSRQSLAESSRELTEKENSQKRKFDQVEVITGEESESNVLQMNCKLYAWVSGSWQERGRGILRLNDWDAGQEIHSRLVIRTQGTLTVMLNTKVWSDMSVERASSKSVRFTALDADGQPKIFLAMGSPKDVDLLYNSLEWRVAASRSQTNEEAQADSVKKPKKEDGGAESLTS
ncbi:nucleolar and coiled-body phosphoprotein 1-like isoform X2 [Penaeus japonicus]|uniref:nucleolar and coiled-body phosphoprotein 1-like isoform X2 n=1 Tax=Penaeus japonicus TaxID=27405 RepID=UPI001C7137B5|nr:nucleolar and coiled-body phosphoprotein 1-like isoform X2 [Penaeus japonicus]